MMTENFKKEILDVLEFNNKTIKDIEWLGFNDCVIENDIENFLSLADIEHEVSFCCPTINGSFLIVGKDWWIEIDDYDGYQDLVFRTKPSKPEKTVRVDESREFLLMRPEEDNCTGMGMSYDEMDAYNDGIDVMYDLVQKAKPIIEAEPKSCDGCLNKN